MQKDGTTMNLGPNRIEVMPLNRTSFVIKKVDAFMSYFIKKRISIYSHRVTLCGGSLDHVIF